MGCNACVSMTRTPKMSRSGLIRALASWPVSVSTMFLPAHSGSDRILRRHAPRLHTADYLALVQRLREEVPNLALTSDLIVAGESR